MKKILFQRKKTDQRWRWLSKGMLGKVWQRLICKSKPVWTFTNGLSKRIQSEWNGHLRLSAFHVRTPQCLKKENNRFFVNKRRTSPKFKRCTATLQHIWIYKRCAETFLKQNDVSFGKSQSATGRSLRVNLERWSLILIRTVNDRSKRPKIVSSWGRALYTWLKKDFIEILDQNEMKKVKEKHLCKFLHAFEKELLMV